MEDGEFIRIKDSDGDIIYYKTEQMSNGQTAGIYFLKYELSDKTLFYVGFAVANKRKHITKWYMGENNSIGLKETGKCGLEALAWAKRQILEFEKWVQRRYSGRITICVEWDDNRRRKVYEYGLKKVGYNVGLLAGSKCLYKKIS